MYPRAVPRKRVHLNHQALSLTRGCPHLLERVGSPFFPTLSKCVRMQVLTGGLLPTLSLLSFTHHDSALAFVRVHVSESDTASSPHYLALTLACCVHIQVTDRGGSVASTEFRAWMERISQLESAVSDERSKRQLFEVELKKMRSDSLFGVSRGYQATGKAGGGGAPPPPAANAMTGAAAAALRSKAR